MNDDYTPTTDEIRRAWWMDTDNPFDNEGASDVSFDRWLAAHDAALLAAHPAPAFKTGWVNGENYIASNAAQPATAIDREPLAPAAERQDIADRLREIANTHDQQAAYMLSYEADFIREFAERISPEVASGVLNGQTESNA